MQPIGLFLAILPASLLITAAVRRRPGPIEGAYEAADFLPGAPNDTRSIELGRSEESSRLTTRSSNSGQVIVEA
jgi:hypothetical protein